MRDFAMQATRRQADHDARLDAEELAEILEAELATEDAACLPDAFERLVADYPHEDGLF